MDKTCKRCPGSTSVVVRYPVRLLPKLRHRSAGVLHEGQHLLPMLLCLSDGARVCVALHGPFHTSGVVGVTDQVKDILGPGFGDSRVFSIDYDTDTKKKVWTIPIPISRPRDGQNSIPIPILIPRLCKCYKVKYEEMSQFIEWGTQK